MMEEIRIITRLFDVPGIAKVETYLQQGGYEALRRVLREKKPEDVVGEVVASGLRGRGGAGFPAGKKWQFLPAQHEGPRYFMCNADESEPGTFKDRLIMEKMPHLLLEGLAIACYATKVPKAYIYVRGEYVRAYEILKEALKEAYEKGFFGKNIFESGFDLEVVIFLGAGAYICGEESALLSSLEGKRGYPKIKPPFPAVSGYMRQPTIINNVETLANLPWILTHGGKAYAAIGTEQSTGTRLFCVSGPLQRPGVYEVPMGYPLKDLLEKEGGGLLDGKRLKAVIPGGSSAPVMTANEAGSLTLDFETAAKMGTMLGSGGIIVIPEEQCMVELLYVIAEFYHHESCGQCTPCREGTGWMEKIIAAILSGKGRKSDLDLLLSICDNIAGGRSICALSDAAALPVKSFVTKFRSEFESHIALGRCDLGGPEAHTMIFHEV